MPVDKRIVSVVKKSLNKFDFTRLEEKCTNEAQTRLYLIEPLLEILGYSRIDDGDMLTEFNAGWGQKNDKADIGLIQKGKAPEIIIECKKFGKKLTDKEASQLNNYYLNTKGAKIGILTNGTDWLFYTNYESTKNPILFPTPFLVLNFETVTDELIENFAKFHKNADYLKEVYEEAQEFFFLSGFQNALSAELADPSELLIKAIFNRMEGKQLNEPIKNKIRAMVNSRTIQESLPFIMEEEAKNGTIVITTAEELKIYHAVKTILLNKFKKIDPSRISYRDQKNSFNIVVDDNNQKLVAKITSSRGKYAIEVPGNGNKAEVQGLESVIALKKQIEEAAAAYLV
jgi:predicted type IV restriction endonuclease